MRHREGMRQEARGTRSNGEGMSHEEGMRQEAKGTGNSGDSPPMPHAQCLVPSATSHEARGTRKNGDSPLVPHATCQVPSAQSHEAQGTRKNGDSPLMPHAKCLVPSAKSPVPDVPKIKSYKDLLVWQKGMLLAKFVYSQTQQFPDSERYGLTAQIRRAAVSVPSNIAEGYGRNSTDDYIRFLRISIGSLYEIQTQLEIAAWQEYITGDESQNINELTIEIEKMMISMIKKISANKITGRKR
jgi:four helix bundle protein